MPKTLLFIPVYNEEKSIPEVIPAIRAQIDSLSGLLFINDGSSDNSAMILEEQLGKLSRETTLETTLLTNSPNRGYGAVTRQALEFAREKSFDFMISMDCDRQHNPADIGRFASFDPSVELVSGSRYHSESTHVGAAPGDRVEINRRITRRLNRLYGWNITDSFCGFKRYKLARIQPELFKIDGYAFPLEFWSFCGAEKLTISELAVNRIYTTDDRSFGADLDQQRKRYRYYLKTLSEAQRRFTTR